MILYGLPYSRHIETSFSLSIAYTVHQNSYQKTKRKMFWLVPNTSVPTQIPIGWSTYFNLKWIHYVNKILDLPEFSLRGRRSTCWILTDPYYTIPDLCIYRYSVNFYGVTGLRFVSAQAWQCRLGNSSHSHTTVSHVIKEHHRLKLFHICNLISWFCSSIILHGVDRSLCLWGIFLFTVRFLLWSCSGNEGVWVGIRTWLHQ